MGHDIRVVTIKIQPDLDNDLTLLGSLPEGIRIFRTTTIDPWRSYQKIKQRVLALPLGSLLNKIASMLLFPLCQPDHMSLWVPFSFFRSYGLNRAKPVDTVYTSSPPHSVHLVGWLLKRFCGLRWIVDLRDPIVDNVIADQIGPFENRVLQRLERLIFKRADVIIANTKEAARLFRAKYAEARVEVVHNSFDEEEFPESRPPKFERFTLTHIGSLYGPRKATGVLRAVSRLHHDKFIDSKHFRLLFVGLNDGSLMSEVRDCGIGDYVEISALVPHAKALEIAARSHLLLLIKAFGRNSSAQIPGKLFEYLATGNKILCIGPAECEAAEIIRSAEGGYVVNNEPSKLSNAILAEYQRFLKNDMRGDRGNPQHVNRFTSANMARRVHEILATL